MAANISAASRDQHLRRLPAETRGQRLGFQNVHEGFPGKALLARSFISREHECETENSAASSPLKNRPAAQPGIRAWIEARGVEAYGGRYAERSARKRDRKSTRLNSSD